MKRFWFLSLLGSLTLGFTLILTGCPAKKGLTSPSNPSGLTDTFTPTSTTCANNQGTPCTATVTVTPTSTFYLIPTYTPYPSPTAGPPPSGIYWDSSLVGHDVFSTVSSGTTIQFLAFVELAVNGNPESTCGVTLTCPGGPVPLPYRGTITNNGNVYSDYRDNLSFSYVVGGSYSLSTVTSIGTASATLLGPGGITDAADGSTSGWSSGGTYQHVIVFSPFSQYTFATPLRYGLVPPVNIPASAYGAGPGIYQLVTECYSDAPSITNGSGSYEVSDFYLLELSK